MSSFTLLFPTFAHLVSSCSLFSLLLSAFSVISFTPEKAGLHKACFVIESKSRYREIDVSAVGATLSLDYPPVLAAGRLSCGVRETVMFTVRNTGEVVVSPRFNPNPRVVSPFCALLLGAISCSLGRFVPESQLFLRVCCEDNA